MYNNGLIGFGIIILNLVLLLTLTKCSTTLNSEKTQITTGRIVGTIYNPIIGDDWSAKAWYEFVVDDQKYIDTIYVSKDGLVPLPGQQIEIEFQTKDPTKNKVKH